MAFESLSLLPLLPTNATRKYIPEQLVSKSAARWGTRPHLYHIPNRRISWETIYGRYDTEKKSSRRVVIDHH